MDILRKKLDGVSRASEEDFGTATHFSESSMLELGLRSMMDPDGHSICDRDSPDPERRRRGGYRWSFNLSGGTD